MAKDKTKRRVRTWEPPADAPLPYAELAPGIGFARVYWVNGHVKKGAPVRNDVKDPPCSGWNSVIVVDENPRSYYATLFCPHTFGTFQVSKDGLEWSSLKPMRDGRAWLELYLPEQWDRMVRFGFQRDFDVAAKVFSMLSIPVPTSSTGAREVESKPRGGKEVASKLLRPVKRGSRRGEVLAFFLEKDGRSAREGVNHFGITRSNLLSQLFVLQRDHGIGYTLVGDSVRISLPKGCEDPFV